VRLKNEKFHPSGITRFQRIGEIKPPSLICGGDMGSLGLPARISEPLLASIFTIEALSSPNLLAQRFDVDQVSHMSHSSVSADSQSKGNQESRGLPNDPIAFQFFNFLLLVFGT
jgi:hypothetical protein